MKYVLILKKIQKLSENCQIPLCVAFLKKTYTTLKLKNYFIQEDTDVEMKQITLEKCQRKVENKHDKFLEWKTDKEMIKRDYTSLFCMESGLPIICKKREAGMDLLHSLPFPLPFYSIGICIIARISLKPYLFRITILSLNLFI